jgi:hypothetical protein
VNIALDAFAVVKGHENSVPAIVIEFDPSSGSNMPHKTAAAVTIQAASVTIKFIELKRLFVRDAGAGPDYQWYLNGSNKLN